MLVVQTPTFAKAGKKLNKAEKKELDQAVKLVAASPALGDLKVADLARVRVYKFRMNRQLALLAYDYQEKSKRLILLMFGSHENFYRDLKKNVF